MLRVAFFGSPLEAVESLETLLAAGHELAVVYTRPDRRAGRGNKLAQTPVKTAALAAGLEVRQPQSLREAGALEELARVGADLFVVVAYGRILPPAALEIPRLGTVNIHPSLLPTYRGPSPVQTAILDGAAHTGVTLMALDEGMDSGPVIRRSEPEPMDGSERAGELMCRLFSTGAAMLPETLERLADGDLAGEAQDEALATFTKIVKRSDGEADWSVAARQIERMVRAYGPWPGVFTSWNRRTVKILDAAVSGESSGAQPGSVYRDGERVLVATGDGSLELRRVQLEGRRPMAVEDFLRGQPDFVNAVLPS